MGMHKLFNDDYSGKAGTPTNEVLTCPECTSPHPLPEGVDRCNVCEIQEYTARHTKY